MRKNEELSASSPGTPILPAAQRWQLRLPYPPCRCLSTLFLISALSQPQPPNRPTRASTPAKPVTPVVAEAPTAAPYTVEAIRRLDPRLRRDTRASYSSSSTRTTGETTSRPSSRAHTSNRIGSPARNTRNDSRRRSSARRLHAGRQCRWCFRVGTNGCVHPAHGMPSGTLWNAF